MELFDGVAPGQSAVFYDGERLLGGGTISATVGAALAEAEAGMAEMSAKFRAGGGAIEVKV